MLTIEPHDVLRFCFFSLPQVNNCHIFTLLFYVQIFNLSLYFLKSETLHCIIKLTKKSLSSIIFSWSHPGAIQTPAQLYIICSVDLLCSWKFGTRFIHHSGNFFCLSPEFHFIFWTLCLSPFWFIALRSEDIYSECILKTLVIHLLSF